MEPKVRKMAMVVNKVKMEEEDELDVLFWLSKTPSERIAAVTALRKAYFTWTNGEFPDKIVKVVNKRPL